MHQVNVTKCSLRGSEPAAKQRVENCPIVVGDHNYLMEVITIIITIIVITIVMRKALMKVIMRIAQLCAHHFFHLWSDHIKGG